MKTRMLICFTALICAQVFSGSERLVAQDDAVLPAVAANKAAAEAQRAAAEAQKFVAEAQKKAIELIQGGPDGKTFILALDEVGENLPPSEYWLGVQVAAVPDVAKKQLALDDGLAVEEVTEGSPAAKAEIKKFDILVKAAETPLKSLGDLVKAIDASQGKELTVTIVRDGKRQTLKVVAEKRPVASSGSVEAIKKTITATRPELAGEIKRLEEALESLKSKVGKEGVGMWFAKPGVVAPRVDVRLPEAKTARAIVQKAYGEFPKDMTVDIRKQGTGPAKIHVKRGDQAWEVTDDKLSELPADIQHFVEQMLGKPTADSITLRLAPPAKVAIPEIAPSSPKPPVAPRAAIPPKGPTAPEATRAYAVHTQRTADDVDRKLTALMKYLEGQGGTLEKLDKLDKKVDDLRKEIDELRTKK